MTITLAMDKTTTNLFLAVLSYSVYASVQQCPTGPNWWTSGGMYCYYVLVDSSLFSWSMYGSSATCASMNSSLPVFSNATEYNIFYNYWTSTGNSAWGFYMNLYSYNNITWSWMNDGSPMVFNNFTAATNSTFPCAGIIGGIWRGSSCYTLRAGVVCQTMRTDYPQPCLLINRSFMGKHRFTTDKIFSLQNGYHSETTYGKFFALSSYIEGITATVYEMSTTAGNTILAYGTSEMAALNQSNFKLNKVAFYLPILNLTGTESTGYIVWRCNSTTLPTDSMLTLLPEKISATTVNGYILKNQVLTYQNSSTYCNNLQIDCVYSNWTIWSACNVTCGNGTQSRNRTLISPAIGQNCSSSILSQSQDCNVTSCPTTTATVANTATSTTLPPISTTTTTILQTSVTTATTSPTTTAATTAGLTYSPVQQQIFGAIGIQTVLSDPISLATTVEASTPYFLTSVNMLQKMQLGFTLDENVQTCIYNGQFCDKARDFQTTYDPTLGNCFTFNYPTDSLYSVYRAGELYGLTILLNSSQSDYTCSTMYAGFRINIHNSSTFPFVDNMGFEIVPGYINTIAITQFHTTLLQKPYGDCVSALQSVDEYYYPLNYTTEKSVLSICGCGDPKYPVPADKVHCNLTQKSCVDSISACESDLKSSSCNCLSPCWESTFRHTITKSKFFNSAFVLEYCSSQSTPIEECIQFANQNFAVLKIYFQELAIINYEEQHAYGIMNLFSDFNGVVGLLLGICIITVPEVVVFLASLCFLKCKCC